MYARTPFVRWRQTRKGKKKGVSFCRYIIGRIYLNATEKNPTPPLMITRFGRNYYSLAHSLAGSYTHACTHIIRNICNMYTYYNIFVHNHTLTIVPQTFSIKIAVYLTHLAAHTRNSYVKQIEYLLSLHA